MGVFINSFGRGIPMKCGDLRNKQGLTEKEFLSSYDAGHYERPSVTVDMLVFTVSEEINKELMILLVKRGDHPCLGCWALPGGFVNMRLKV